MFTKISVLIPTRHRIKRLRTLLTSYETTRDIANNSELVFRVDDDDTDTISFLQNYNCVVGPRYQGYRSMPTFYNEMAAAAHGDVLMCGNDDMVFQTPGWPAQILALANKYPDGIFNIGVMTLNVDHYPFSTVSKKMVDALGFIWDPRIFWGDIFLRDLAAKFDRCVKLPHVKIDHDWAGYRPDIVFLETRESKKKIERDPNYTAFNQTIVQEAAEKLQRLVGESQPC